VSSCRHYVPVEALSPCKWMLKMGALIRGRRRRVGTQPGNAKFRPVWIVFSKL
jgi:hypothetical protein